MSAWRVFNNINNINNQKQQLIKSNTINEKIILFDIVETTKNNKNLFKIILSNKSIYFVFNEFNQNQTEKISLLNILDINIFNEYFDKKINIRFKINNNNQSNKLKHLKTILIKTNDDIFDNFYDLKGLKLKNIKPVIFKMILNRLIIDFWKNKISKIISKNEMYQYHIQCIKLSKHNHIINSLLLITSINIYYILLNYDKNDNLLLKIKNIKWSFSLKSIKSIICDKYLNYFNSILFQFEIIDKNDKNDNNKNIKEIWKKFAFIDNGCFQLLFQSILRFCYFKQSTNNKYLFYHLNSINCKNSISGHLLKMRKLNPNNTIKRKIKLIIIESGISFIEIYKNCQIDRYSIIGFSTNLKSQIDNSRFIALISTQRIIGFLFESLEEKDKWLKFMINNGLKNVE